jgi:hypothetical protein
MLLKEIKLRARHPLALRNFYEEILELPTEYYGGNITVTAGRSTLIFEEADIGVNPYYHFAFNIPSNKFEEAFECIEKKVKLLWLDDYNGYIADFVNWNAKSFYFLDPAGNILELISRFGLNDIASEKFSSKLIRNISEIGLVLPADSFQSEVDKLLQTYPLPYFDKQPPLAQFKAVGDDEGLFIIAPENRVWFSTNNTTSKLFPMEICFIQNGTLCKLKR